MILDASSEVRGMATGQIGSAHTASKQDIPPNHPAILVVHEDHMTRSVTWGVAHLNLGLAPVQGLAMLKAQHRIGQRVPGRCRPRR